MDERINVHLILIILFFFILAAKVLQIRHKGVGVDRHLCSEGAADSALALLNTPDSLDSCATAGMDIAVREAPLANLVELLKNKLVRDYTKRRPYYIWRRSDIVLLLIKVEASIRDLKQTAILFRAPKLVLSKLLPLLPEALLGVGMPPML
jgi:hypothetical protein